MRRAKIEEQNGFMLTRQREFRIAADVVAKAWAGFSEVAPVQAARPLEETPIEPTT